MTQTPGPTRATEWVQGQPGQTSDDLRGHKKIERRLRL